MFKRMVKRYYKRFWRLFRNRATISSLLEYAAGVYCNLETIWNDGHLVLPASGGEWCTYELWSGHRIAYVPTPFDADHGTSKHLKKLEAIYSDPPWVAVEQNDVVVDVGAYVGTFTRVAAKNASTVIAVDPNAAISNALDRNTRSFGNVIIVRKAAWKEACQLNLNLSLAANDNSLLSIDSQGNDLRAAVQVEADTISNIVREQSIDCIDLLKIEAEGVEPEVLEGALDGNVAVRKIVVNCGPEREGKAPTKEVEALLRDANYRFWTRSNNPWGIDVVFAVDERW